MQTDINDTAKVGFTIFLILCVVGMVVNVNMITIDYVRAQENEISNVMSVSDYQTICDVCDTGDPLTGAGLYSLVTEYGGRMTGILIEKSVWNILTNNAPNVAGAGSKDTSVAYVYTHNAIQNREIDDLLNVIYTYGINYKFNVVRSKESGMETTRQQVFIYIKSCSKIGG